MKDNEIDKLFSKNLESAKIKVDVEDLWKEVQPKAKKKNLLFFFLFLIGGFICSGFVYFLFGNKVEDKREWKTNRASLENEARASSSLPNIKELEDNSKSSLMEVSKTKPYYEINKKQKLQFEKAMQKQSNIKTIPIKQATKNSVDLKEVNTMSTVGISDSSELKTKHQKTKLIFLAKMSHVNEPLEIETLKSWYPYGVIQHSDLFELDTLKFEIKHNSQKHQKLTVGIAIGYGIFNTHLNNNTPESKALIDQRQTTEKDRFSVHLETDLSYWIHKNFGTSFILAYQKHYAYFQKEIDFNDYTNIGFKSTYLTNSRRIKSNIILSQLHTSLLFNYQLTLKNLNFILSMGPTYNFYNHGEGKQFGAKDEIINLSEQQQRLQSTALGLSTKLKVQYPLSERLMINVGINSHYQSKSIMSNEGINQQIKSLYYSLGLSWRL